jgi:Family of unknown function (DUF6282)
MKGGIDLYVHAAPDLLPRQHDDVALAVGLAQAGLSGAVHRHHYTDTTARGSLVREQTGFSLLGAVLLNDSVGGLNPAAVEVALRLGSCWVGLPTLSSQHFRRQLQTKPDSVRGALSIGPGRLALVDPAGQLRPELFEILDLAAEHHAVLGMGYGAPEELGALAVALRGRDQPAVLTYPHISGLEATTVAELIEGHNAYVEICAYRLHPDGPAGGGGDPLREALALLKAVGPDRVILSSDGGMVGAPPPATLLGWAISLLANAGVSAGVLRQLVVSNPDRILGPHAPPSHPPQVRTAS